MKYLDEFRDGKLAKRLFAEIAQATTQPWAIMEVCGGQTHTIIRNGIDQLLPDEIELIHGPGCPVCVTPLDVIDKALAIAAQPDVIILFFWRHASCSRQSGRSVYRQELGRRRANRLLATRQRANRRTEP